VDLAVRLKDEQAGIVDKLFQERLKEEINGKDLIFF